MKEKTKSKLKIAGLALASIASVGMIAFATAGLKTGFKWNRVTSEEGSPAKTTEDNPADHIVGLSMNVFKATDVVTAQAITATITPSDATIKTVHWTVSDTTAIGFSATSDGTYAATIDSESGAAIYIKALKNFSGSVAVVAASAFNNAIKATCTCTYYNRVASVTPIGISDEADGAYNLSGQIAPGDGTCAKWASLGAGSNVSCIGPITFYLKAKVASNDTANPSGWYSAMTSAQKAGTSAIITNVSTVSGNGVTRSTIWLSAYSFASAAENVTFKVTFNSVYGDRVKLVQPYDLNVEGIWGVNFTAATAASAIATDVTTHQF